MVMAELGRKFGVPDSDGVLLTFEPTISDLAEMIGSSRPVVSRVMADLIEDGEIGGRDRKYILLHGGAIEMMSASVPTSAMGMCRRASRPQHRAGLALWFGVSTGRGDSRDYRRWPAYGFGRAILGEQGAGRAAIVAKSDALTMDRIISSKWFFYVVIGLAVAYLRTALWGAPFRPLC